MLLCGNFNQPAISWIPRDVYFVPSASTISSTYFADGMNECNLRQLSGVTNSLHRQLDLIFVNDAAVFSVFYVSCSLDPIVGIDKYHPAIDFIMIGLQPGGNLYRENRIVFNFPFMDVDKFNEILANYQ